MMISIINPTYNRAVFLRQAVEPFMTATGSLFECVIVDDASTDETGDMVAALPSKWRESGMVFLRQETNQGAQAARNRGIESATGEFLLFMDSDDVPRIEGIVELYKHLQRNPELGYCFGRVQKTNAQLKPLGEHALVGSPFGEDPWELAGYHWHTMGALYRRSCIERVGRWNPDLTGSQDWEYQARVKLFGGKGEFVDTIVGYWRQHDGERVGTARFRPDYVRSVMKACESIMSNAREAGRVDAVLEQRLAKKLMVHALEWGANGHSVERRECLDAARGCLSKPQLLSGLIKLAKMMPAGADGMIWRRLVK